MSSKSVRWWKCSQLKYLDRVSIQRLWRIADRKTALVYPHVIRVQAPGTALEDPTVGGLAPQIGRVQVWLVPAENGESHAHPADEEHLTVIVAGAQPVEFLLDFGQNRLVGLFCLLSVHTNGLRRVERGSST